jgi:hypothetical protein
VSVYKTYFVPPNRLLDTFDAARTTPEILSYGVHDDQYTYQHQRCKHDNHSPRTRDDSQRILQDYLSRTFEDHLAYEVVEQIITIMGIPVNQKLNECRIVELLLGGMSLDQLASPAFAKSNAIILVRVLLYRYGFEVEQISSHAAVRSTFNSFKCIQEIAEAGSHLPAIPVTSIPHLTPLELKALFKRIKYYIKRGDLGGKDFKDPIVWQEKIEVISMIFAEAIEGATRDFVKSTSTFAAAVRHFLSHHTTMLQFWEVLFHPETPEEDKDPLNKWWDGGALLEEGDEIFATRKAELDFMKNSSGKALGGSKSAKNAKKKAKRALKLKDDNEVERIATELQEWEVDKAD